MFILQKILSNIIISPGIFIILLLMVLFFSFRKKTLSKMRRIIVLIAVLIYLFSINPIKDKIVGVAEKKYAPITKSQLEKGDSYILLGGGAYREVPNSLGESKGVPTDHAFRRIIEVAKLYRYSPKKVIITGGSVYGEKVSEASIYRKFLLDLGVSSKDIFLEEESKTTEENAEYTKKLIERLNLKSPILITSALHMARSQYAFEKNNIEVIPAPTDYRMSNKKKYQLDDYFPNSVNFVSIKSAIWEYIGIGFYFIKNILKK